MAMKHDVNFTTGGTIMNKKNVFFDSAIFDRVVGV